jgi:V/A-type H+-transporting ATPase subunit B
MKDGIGEGYTRADHPDLANQLFSSYARVAEVRGLASVIGEEELSELDKSYMEFGELFENHYLNQSRTENRPIETTIDLGWKILGLLPKSELDRIDAKFLDAHYQPVKREDFRLEAVL